MALFYDDIAKLARHRTVLGAYEKFLSLRKPDYPDMSYIGLNFRKGRIVSLKFYFSLYRRIDAGDVEAFLPHSGDFLRYYDLWEPSRKRSAEHTGCAFTVKFRGAGEPDVGFHYRLLPERRSYDLVGHSSQLPFSWEELSSRPGINYEYSPDGSSRRRRYYYLWKADQKDYIANRFGKPFASRAKLCEFTEYDGGSKVILWTPEYTPEYMNRPCYLDAQSGSALQRLRKEYGLINVMDGYYDDSETVSTYFFNTLGQKTGNIAEGSLNFHLDTLSLFVR